MRRKEIRGMKRRRRWIEGEEETYLPVACSARRGEI
jgi:hypothetical protein